MYAHARAQLAKRLNRMTTSYRISLVCQNFARRLQISNLFVALHLLPNSRPLLLRRRVMHHVRVMNRKLSLNNTPAFTFVHRLHVFRLDVYVFAQNRTILREHFDDFGDFTLIRAGDDDDFVVRFHVHFHSRRFPVLV